VAALPTSTEYELLIRDLTSRISAKAGVNTTRLEHNVRLQGRATTNQIDVLWDFTDEQGKLHAFRSVVDDVQDHSRSVKGVMVTTVGYQRGAKTIADTYGLLILELRPPLPQDLKDRLNQIDIQMVVQHVSVTEVDCKAVEIHEPAVEGISYAVEHMTLVPRPGEPGEPRRLLDVLTAGELGELGSPRAPHPVQRTFDPPVELWMGEQRIALLQAVEAMVGELPGRPATITIGGVESLAYMLRDTLTNARVWFAADGRVWATD
jgi:hypothetical protein